MSEKIEDRGLKMAMAPSATLYLLSSLLSLSAAAAPVSYYRDVRPILMANCVACHKPDKTKGELDMTTHAALLKGGKHGKAVVPGKAEESLLYKVLKGETEVGGDKISHMPKARPGQDVKPVPDEQVGLIKQWIDQGAK